VLAAVCSLLGRAAAGVTLEAAAAAAVSTSMARGWEAPLRYVRHVGVFML
jgi:hypothetical protein